MDEQTHFKNAMILCKKLMPEKAYGPRLEVTLQNPTSDDLVNAFKALQQFGHASMATFNTLKAAHQLNEVPVEFLRVSPLQAVSTSITCLFVEKITTSLALTLYRLLDRIRVGTNLDH